jgi:hypothetical protein
MTAATAAPPRIILRRDKRINSSIPHRSQGINLIPHHSFALVCS